MDGDIKSKDESELIKKKKKTIVHKEEERMRSSYSNEVEKYNKTIGQPTIW